jgi:hypothetical protein
MLDARILGFSDFRMLGFSEKGDRKRETGCSDFRKDSSFRYAPLPMTDFFIRFLMSDIEK